MTNRFANIKVDLLLNLIVSLLFMVVAALVVVLVNYHMRQQALVEAASKARILLDHNLATHTYFSHDLKPSLFQWTEPFRPADYFDPTWMSSTYAVREIDTYFKSLSPTQYYYKEGAIDARSPANEADEFEREFIEALNADPNLEEYTTVRLLDGQPYFVTLRRGEKMEESCIRCHNTPAQAPGEMVELYGPERSFGRQVGEVVSAISIRVPLVAAYGQADRFSWQLSGFLLLLLLALFGAQYGVNRRLLLKPLATLRAKALQISASPHHLGEAIALPAPAGRELNDLISAFNAMSIELRRSHDQLEERVRARTAELKLANEQLSAEIGERKRVEARLQQYSERLEEMVAERTQELQTAQEQLLRRQKLVVLGQLSGGLAHQLRNPLGNIKNAGYLLNLSINQPEPAVNEALKILESETNRAERVINSLLDFARTRAPNRAPVDLDRLLREVLAQVALPDASPVELVTGLAGGLPPVQADPVHLNQVFENLLLNAIQAMPAGGRLVVTSERVEPDWVAVSVADSGIGIPPEEIARIFEPLVTTKLKGFGLGLALIRNLVEANGGTVAVKSTAGQGSTFTVRLPLNGALQGERQK